jgi:hypothetical protein
MKTNNKNEIFLGCKKYFFTGNCECGKFCNKNFGGDENEN